MNKKISYSRFVIKMGNTLAAEESWKLLLINRSKLRISTTFL